MMDKTELYETWSELNNAHAKAFEVLNGMVEEQSRRMQTLTYVALDYLLAMRKELDAMELMLLEPE